MNAYLEHGCRGRLRAWALAAMVGMLAGCASGDGSRFVSLTLQATQENAGAIGQVALVDQRGRTGLDFFISGRPTFTPRPVNLLTFIYPGSCAALGDKAAYALNRTSQTTRAGGGWQFSRTAPVSLQELREGDFAVVLQTTPAGHSLIIFCANTNPASGGE